MANSLIIDESKYPGLSGIALELLKAYIENPFTGGMEGAANEVEHARAAMMDSENTFHEKQKDYQQAKDRLERMRKITEWLNNENN